MICQLVLEYFQLQLSDILFFLEAFGLFGIFWPSKGLTAFLRPKNPKKASGLQKKQNVFKLQLKILQKKLTHHEKMPAFFLSLVPYHINAHSSMMLYITRVPNQAHAHSTACGVMHASAVHAPLTCALKKRSKWNSRACLCVLHSYPTTSSTCTNALSFL